MTVVCQIVHGDGKHLFREDFQCTGLLFCHHPLLIACVPAESRAENTVAVGSGLVQGMSGTILGIQLPGPDIQPVQGQCTGITGCSVALNLTEGVPLIVIVGPVISSILPAFVVGSADDLNPQRAVMHFLRRGQRGQLGIDIAQPHTDCTCMQVIPIVKAASLRRTADPGPSIDLSAFLSKGNYSIIKIFSGTFNYFKVHIPDKHSIDTREKKAFLKFGILTGQGSCCGIAGQRVGVVEAEIILDRLYLSFAGAIERFDDFNCFGNHLRRPHGVQCLAAVLLSQGNL